MTGKIIIRITQEFGCRRSGEGGDALFVENEDHVSKIVKNSSEKLLLFLEGQLDVSPPCNIRRNAEDRRSTRGG